MHETVTAGYKNPHLSPAERADDLLRRMTLEEKVAQMLCIWGEKKSILALSNVRLEKPTIRLHEETRVLADVRNTGIWTGQEVVQLYIHDCVSSVTRPVKELKGLAKVTLRPGESKTVALPIGPERLSLTTVSMQYAVKAGDFEIMVGTSSRNEDLTTTILHVTD